MRQITEQHVSDIVRKLDELSDLHDEVCGFADAILRRTVELLGYADKLKTQSQDLEKQISKLQDELLNI